MAPKKIIFLSLIAVICVILWLFFSINSQPIKQLDASNVLGIEPTKNIASQVSVYENKDLKTEIVTDKKEVLSQKEKVEEVAVIPETKEEERKVSRKPKEGIKAIYATGWATGSKNYVNYFIKLIKDTEANAIVIDLKDYGGVISYKTNNPKISEYGGEQSRIKDIKSTIDFFKKEGVYLIGRITVFQDPILASKRPDLAIKTKSGDIWLDNRKIAWIDPSSKDAWDYNIALAKDALALGFDEINFDYIRFPSDGNLRDIQYPISDMNKFTKAEIIKSFFAYLREALNGEIISADLFGLTTVNRDDLGIGQIIEDGFLNFDYVSPMVYPSHYAEHFIGYENPAEYPYEVVKYSLTEASRRLEVLKKENPNLISELRPWLQDFSIGSTYYDATMVASQIRATEEVGISGWMMWSPSNNYTEEAILLDQSHETN